MIVLFGGTGRVGSATVAALRRGTQTADSGRTSTVLRDSPPTAGPLCRVITRRPEEIDLGTDVEIARGNLDDRGSIERALEGATRILVVTPAHPEMDRREVRIINAARSAGVESILKISGTDGLVTPTSRSLTMRQHYTAEAALRASGLHWSILRPSAFIQTLMEQIVPFVRDSRRFSLPGGERRFAFVDVRDIGDVAARILVSDLHWDHIHVLTGPQALAYPDLARIMSDELGDEVVFKRQTLFFARLAMNQRVHYYHARNEAADLAAIFSRHFEDRATDTISKILHRPARGVRDWVREHRRQFFQ